MEIRDWRKGESLFQNWKGVCVFTPHPPQKKKKFPSLERSQQTGRLKKWFFNWFLLLLCASKHKNNLHASPLQGQDPRGSRYPSPWNPVSRASGSLGRISAAFLSKYCPFGAPPAHVSPGIREHPGTPRGISRVSERMKRGLRHLDGGGGALGGRFTSPGCTGSFLTTSCPALPCARTARPRTPPAHTHTLQARTRATHPQRTHRAHTHAHTDHACGTHTYWPGHTLRTSAHTPNARAHSHTHCTHPRHTDRSRTPHPYIQTLTHIPGHTPRTRTHGRIHIPITHTALTHTHTHTQTHIPIPHTHARMHARPPSRSPPQGGPLVRGTAAWGDSDALRPPEPAGREQGAGPRVPVGVARRQP